MNPLDRRAAIGFILRSDARRAFVPKPLKTKWWRERFLLMFL